MRAAVVPRPWGKKGQKEEENEEKEHQQQLQLSQVHRPRRKKVHSHFAAPDSLLPRATVYFACGARSDCCADHFVTVVNAALFSSYLSNPSPSKSSMCRDLSNH